MNKYILVAVFVLTGCVPGPRFYDCPAGEGEAAVDVAIETWPSSAEILYRVDVFCRETEPMPSIPCLTWQYGSGQIPGQRAKYEVLSDLVGPCIIHEAHHSGIFIDRGDGCASHDPDCGWDAQSVDDATSKL